MKYLAISDFKEWQLAETLALQHQLPFESQLYTKNENLVDVPAQEAYVIHSSIKNHSYHGPFRGLHHVSSDLLQIEQAYEHYSRFYDIVAKRGATHVVFHSDYHPSEMDDRFWTEKSLVFWNRFLADKDGSIEIHIENVYEPNYRALAAVVDALDKEWVKVCLDVGHANMSSTIPVEDWAAGLGNRIGSVHLHNNDGTGDQHRGLQSGTIDMESTLKNLEELAPEAVWVLETYEKEASLEWLQARQFV